MSTGVFEREASTASRPVSAVMKSHKAIPIAIAIGAAPLLFWHLVQTLQKPHYQFLAFLPVALWAIATCREPANFSNRDRPWPAVFLAVLSVLGLAAATFVWSPWLGWVAAMIGVVPWLWWQGGWSLFREWRDAWILAWLAVPIPFGLDERLIVRLRDWTTRLSSGVLDQVGILHLQYGNVIELPKKSLFTADACSGVHSLFVLLATAIFLGLWMKRSWLHICVLTAATFVIVLIENVSRIVLIAAGVGWDVDLSQGIGHSALGYALFCVSILLIVSTDQLLLFPMPRFGGREKGFRTPAARRQVSPGARLAAGRLWAGASLVLFAAGLVLMPKSLPAWGAFVPSNFDMADLGENLLPEEMAGFKRVDYSTVQRVFGDPLGQASQQWTYTRGDMTALISVDYPYDGVHDLTQCYSGIGWKIESDDMQVVPDANLSPALKPAEAGSSAVVKMSRPLFGHGLLMFSLVNAEGAPSATLKSKAQGTPADQAARRLTSFAARRTPSEPTSTGPFVQFQLHARAAAPFSDDRTAALATLYLAARERLLPKCRAELKGESR